MFTRKIALFSLLGFKVNLDISWLFLAVLVVWSLATGYFPYQVPGLDASTYWSMAIIGAAGLFFSIVFHEFSHSLVARHYGLPISGITLFIFGGVAEMEEEPENPKVEFLMAAAGPLASFFLAALFWLTARFLESQSFGIGVAAVASYLALINAIVAVFNLIPGFPLDGGRMLRAVLWYWKDDLRWGTRIATGVGDAFGLVLIILGVISIFTGNFIGGMWWFLIGLFLRGAAAASYNQLQVRRLLQGEPIARFMTRNVVVAPPHISLHELIEDYIYAYHYDMFPVVEQDRLIGYVTARDLKETPRELWGHTTVRAISRPLDDGTTIEAQEDALKALAQMRKTGNSRLLVTDRGRLVGIVVLKDLLEFLTLKIDLEGLDR
ncbi:site-2 protease family protein [Luteithermobacter gelatinilyticus]|uniref:site-2 protease family protein n=1 Tax=Luteithermobacter gelatinilyticus TaxID=2582913 RepID=UPI001106D79C|nr:site-2 protease family protein [Luteithermobacter gelatinilyticus]